MISASFEAIHPNPCCIIKQKILQTTAMQCQFNACIYSRAVFSTWIGSWRMIPWRMIPCILISSEDSEGQTSWVDLTMNPEWLAGSPGSFTLHKHSSTRLACQIWPHITDYNSPPKYLSSRNYFWASFTRYNSLYFFNRLKICKHN